MTRSHEIFSHTETTVCSRSGLGGSTNLGDIIYKDENP